MSVVTGMPVIEPSYRNSSKPLDTWLLKGSLISFVQSPPFSSAAGILWHLDVKYINSFVVVWTFVVRDRHRP
jgi:hypothetical protein